MKDNKGFTIAELLIGTALGVIVVYGGIQVLETTMDTNKEIQQTFTDNIESLTYKKFSGDFIDLIDTVGYSTLFYAKFITISQIKECISTTIKCDNDQQECPGKKVYKFREFSSNRKGQCFLSLNKAKQPNANFIKLEDLIKNSGSGDKINFFKDHFNNTKKVESIISREQHIPIKYQTKELNKDRYFIGWNLEGGNISMMIEHHQLNGFFRVDPEEGHQDSACIEGDDYGRCNDRNKKTKATLASFQGELEGDNDNKTIKNLDEYINQFHVVYSDKFNELFYLTRITDVIPCIVEQGSTNIAQPGQPPEYDYDISPVKCKYFVTDVNGDLMQNKLKAMYQSRNTYPYVVVEESYVDGYCKPKQPELNVCHQEDPPDPQPENFDKCSTLFDGSITQPKFDLSNLTKSDILPDYTDTFNISIRTFINIFTVMAGGPRGNSAASSNAIIAPVDILKFFVKKSENNQNKSLCLQKASNDWKGKNMIHNLPIDAQIVMGRQLNTSRFSAFIFSGEQEETIEQQ